MDKAGDNVLNNGFEEKQAEKAKEKIKDKEKSAKTGKRSYRCIGKRPSLRKRLKEKQEQVAAVPERPAKERDRSMSL